MKSKAYEDLTDALHDSVKKDPRIKIRWYKGVWFFIPTLAWIKGDIEFIFLGFHLSIEVIR